MHVLLQQQQAQQRPQQVRHVLVLALVLGLGLLVA
jgi:hypothetical protein